MSDDPVEFAIKTHERFNPGSYLDEENRCEVNIKRMNDAALAHYRKVLAEKESAEAELVEARKAVHEKTLAHKAVCQDFDDLEHTTNIREQELAEAKALLARENKSANYWYMVSLNQNMEPALEVAELKAEVGKWKEAYLEAETRACGRHEARAENERLLKDNAALAKIQEDYDIHLRMCPQKSREQFKKAMDELAFYADEKIYEDEVKKYGGLRVGFRYGPPIMKDKGRRARAVIQMGEE